MFEENELRSFGGIIQKLINKEDLSREETYAAFKEILTNKQPDLQQGALLAALVSKGETIQEIAGAWQAIHDFDTVELKSELPAGLIDNSGTGMDSLKTFNVSSAAAIVACACGAKVARHGARALTSFYGTVDILEAVGLDVECDSELVENSINTVGIGLFNGMSPMIHPSALGRILSQIRFGSTLNIAASLANPARPEYGLRGVYNQQMLKTAAAVMSEIGYQRAMVVHGTDSEQPGGMDELSITGKSIVVEFNNGQPGDESEFHPSDIGLQAARFEEIASLRDLKKESIRFVQVLSGKNHRACIDFTCLNAGAALYVAGKAENIKQGVDMSLAAVESGQALNKLREWITTQNRDPAKAEQTLMDIEAKC